MIPPSPVHERFVAYALDLQSRIVAGLAKTEPTPFELTSWTRPEGGGGRMGLVRGQVIEKGAVHFSSVWGETNPLTGRPFHAAGVSLILHPRNPHAPTVHMNVRHFHEAEGGWWGGGTDLTPLGVHHPEDAQAFHATLREALGERYEPGRAEADRYFHVPHRGRPRGAGGVFYDHVEGDEAGFELVRRIGDSFLDCYLPILARRHAEPWTQAQREAQCRERGVYVEFNLLYDKGTRFGLQSGGNVDAILSSMPPVVTW